MAERPSGLPRSSFAPASSSISGIPRQPSTSATASTSRFGYRPPPGTSIPAAGSTATGIAAATPLGKRTASSTSFNDASQPSAVKRPAVRASVAGKGDVAATPPSTGPQSPSASQQLSTLKTQYESRLLLSKQSYDALEDDYRGIVAETGRLESERRSLLEEWEQAKAARAAELESWKSERQAWKQKEAEMRNALFAKDEELQTSRDTSSRERQESQAQLMQMMTKVSRLEAERDQALDTAHSAQEQCQAEVARRQEQEMTVQELERRLSSTERQVSGRENEAAIVSQELDRILAQSKELEREVLTLRSSNDLFKKQAQGAAVLKEDNADLKRKVEAMDNMRQQVVEYQERAEQVQGELEGWNSFLLSSGSSSSKIEAQVAMTASDRDEPIPALPLAPEPLSRSSLPVYIGSLRGTASGLITRCQILQEKVGSSGGKVDELTDILQTTQAELRRAQQSEADWRSKEQGWKQSREEWQDEMRRYRDLLQSYENESGSVVKAPDRDEEMQDGEDESKAADMSMTRISSSQLERISLLEKDLQFQRDEVVRVSSEKDEQIASLRADFAAKDQKLSELEAGVRELQAENAQLDEQLGRAEERLGRGEFDVERYQCLVLKDNPVDRDRDLRKSTMDALERENQELKKRVQDIGTQLAALQASAEQKPASDEGQSGAAAPEHDGWMPASVVETLREEVQSLEVKVASREKAMLRQKESFGDLARIYRATIESLFGFKMQFHGNRLVEVHSILNKAVRPENTRLLFKWKAPAKGQKGDGETVLCQDEGNERTLAKFSEHSGYWLSAERYRMPCFLGAMQMSVYEDVTMAVRSTWTVPDEGEEEE
ncbi:hypothetical protein BCV69DRAFT_297073 [Microstroma glucosiphilum]|uniref:Spindle assembly checkpoint component MAD1 n=1 Tax=Pseudomicrostroma glucosiphilum TaxID=1684307 RepID=A0A316UD22_9BASI|nr:hypothetical protein BCV69DRAFT_297073 [Pseudomicrostroma glucosiphilum]PWN23120.1 hypothetical protein BCV69DRAFT_297073 [Pseudomicrostroma glucosiphilum]